LPTESYQEALTAAVKEISETGFVSQERLEYWQQRLKEAAERAMGSAYEMEQALREALFVIYRRLVEKGGALKYHPGVARFTLNNLSFKLRADLDRRIMASAQLIKMNREQAIAKTLQRFSGWATSIPQGGSEAIDKNAEKLQIKKALSSLPFEERRVLIDQGHKLTASINETIALGGNAIAVVWHSHYRQSGYNYRPDHKDRDGKFYLLRGNWAQEAGLVKLGPAGYYDQITAVGEEVFCRCYATYIYNLRDLPEDMLTVKGKAALEEARRKIQEL